MSQYAYAIERLLQEAYYMIWHRRNDANSKMPQLPLGRGVQASRGIRLRSTIVSTFLCCARVNRFLTHFCAIWSYQNALLLIRHMFHLVGKLPRHMCWCRYNVRAADGHHGPSTLISGLIT